jgi:hypothetical protein
MKFNINNYKGKYVMHCKTEEEARNFCNYLHEHGRRWCSGNSYADNTCWGMHEKGIAYNFNEGCHCDINYYKCWGYTILEWSDFINGTFTKADLKTGDIIKQRDGLVGIVNADLDIAITRGGWLDLSKYNDDLTSKLTDYGFDIMAVRRPIEKHDCQFNAFEYKWGTLIYDRKRDTVEEMTLAEVCKLLGKNIKIIQ